MDSENPNRPDAKISKEWLAEFYNRVTEQYSLSRQSLHNTHQWVITLTFALVTVILTMSGKESMYPNEVGLVALLVSVPLMFRFFVRSCLETSIQYKWGFIREAMDKRNYAQMLHSDKYSDIEACLIQGIRAYYFEWKSPKSLRKVIWDNLRLAYLWPFILLIALIAWGAITLCMTLLIKIVLIVVLIFMIYEVIAFVSYRGFRYERIDMPEP